jgi:ATP-dependent DNA helicase DinG
VLEVEVHSCLKSLLKNQQNHWHHHLTMARLVARALRLNRSALIQTGTSTHQYQLSYLIPALLDPSPVILVIPEEFQQQLLTQIIPQLQQQLNLNKTVKIGNYWQWEKDFSAILLTSPSIWLGDRLDDLGAFPANIPTLIDQADDLEEYTQSSLTASLLPQNWHELIIKSPEFQEIIRDTRIKLIKAIFERPVNPYECWVIEETQKDLLAKLFEIIPPQNLTLSFKEFWQKWQRDSPLLWASINRKKGEINLFCSPINISQRLNPIWQKQTVVMMGSCLDFNTNASIFRQQIGLENVTCLKFSPNANREQFQLYIPDKFPLPNTPEFQAVLMAKIEELLGYINLAIKPVVILLDDVPLKNKIGAILAGKFGSQVCIEKPDFPETGILISGWEFWRKYQFKITTPQLLIIATLPIPSLENPLVAGKVAYYKKQKKDWFRLYLLPHSLREIQRSVLSIRENQAVVALLDNRVNYRSYGTQILESLEPFARCNYIDSSWFLGLK